jgi:hypothetical protein
MRKPSSRIRIDAKAFFSNQGVCRKLHVLQARKEIEEGIRRRRNENAIAFVGQELEQPAVCLARAGAQGNSIGMHRCGVLFVVTAHRRTRCRMAEGQRRVVCTSRVAQEGNHGRAGGKAATGRV